MQLQNSLAIALTGLLIESSSAFSWRAEKGPQAYMGGHAIRPSSRPSEVLTNQLPLPKVFEIALTELQELEEKPFCHRIAAQYLVNNCQLLDGKDETYVLGETGRTLHDFTDAYAASLALCDLERAGISVPKACSPFTEKTLIQIPPQEKPHLHVTSRQIQACMSGLHNAGSSAWATWLSYRDKAIRFCEAARVDQDKAQNILVYERLTRTMSKLFHEVDIELPHRMEELFAKAQQATDAMSQLNPQIDEIQRGLAGIQEYMSRSMSGAIDRSTEAVNAGMQNAEALQQLLATMVQMAASSHSEVASAHERSIDLVTQKTNNQMEIFVTAMARAMASSVSLQDQIEISRAQATDLAQRQMVLEEGIQRLTTVTENLSSKYDAHTHVLVQAQNLTNDILDTLETSAHSATSIQDALSQHYGGRNWWPYIICPVVALVAGSYGLKEPSAIRNLCLLSLGGFVAIVIDFFDNILHWGSLLFAVMNPAMLTTAIT